MNHKMRKIRKTTKLVVLAEMSSTVISTSPTHIKAKEDARKVPKSKRETKSSRRTLPLVKSPVEGGRKRSLKRVAKTKKSHSIHKKLSRFLHLKQLARLKPLGNRIAKEKWRSVPIEKGQYKSSPKQL